MSLVQIEPFLDPNNSRQKLYPIQHKDLWEYYKLHKSSFWVSEEVELYKDVRDWNEKLTDEERHYIKWTLAFFAGSDFIINENQKRMMKKLQFLNIISLMLIKYLVKISILKVMLI